MSMETWKPRRFVEEFQKRAGLLIDGKPGPQTQIALGFVPELPPGRIYPAVPELPEHLRAAPTPIDPADIRPGDVVEARQVHTAERVDERYVWISQSTGLVRDWFTWFLVSRPDPDAEAVQAIRSASYNIHHGDTRVDPLPGLIESGTLLEKLRESGWDVVRRAES